MTQTFREALWDLFEQAIQSGVTPREIVDEMGNAWPELLRQKIVTDSRSISMLLRVVK